jgi:hypothetical protein
MISLFGLNIYGIILVVVIAILICVIVWYVTKTSAVLATPDNIKRISDVQVGLLNQRYMGVSLKRTGIQNAISKLPSDDQLYTNIRLLINTTVLSTRLSGYLGPYINGVFDVDNAVRLSLTTGARLIVLEIGDYKGEPVLTYRDVNGYIRSLNKGQISDFAKSIAARAFNANSDSIPPNVANDPFFVALYFNKTPSLFSSPQEYIKYLGKVAEQLQPLVPFLFSSSPTPQGDFRRQAQESQLFFRPVSMFMGKCIILCNVDTSVFRNLQNYNMTSVASTQDLDLMVHCRLYSRESPSNLGATSGASNSVTPSAVITSAQYWLNTSPDYIADAVSSTKKAFTIVMNPDATSEFDAKTINTLLNTYGVNSIPFVLFNDQSQTDLWLGAKAPYGATAWTVKPQPLRFMPPKPITVVKQSLQANSGGGAVVSPSL